MLYEEILKFYFSLDFDPRLLPEKVAIMNPYQQGSKEVDRVMELFHKKYFNDHAPRHLILGINPGRNGAGLTGIPFTDTPALEDKCEISTSINTKETSSEFIYKWIESYGGPKKFYKNWFIGGVCPLGFLIKNQRGNWVNWNYYDDAKLKAIMTPFILENLKRQIKLCQSPKKAIILGTGKNFQFVSELNKKEKLFTELIAIEHPRYVMQYKRKQLGTYLEKFNDALREVEK